MNQERVLWVEDELVFFERGDTYYLRPINQEMRPVNIFFSAWLTCFAVSGVLCIALAALFGGVK